MDRGVIGVRVHADTGGARVTFFAATPIEYEAKRLTNPTRLLMQFPGAVFDHDQASRPTIVGAGALAKVLLGQDSKRQSVANAVLYLRSRPRVDIARSEDRRTLVVTFDSPRDVSGEPPADAEGAPAEISIVELIRRPSGEPIAIRLLADRAVRCEARSSGDDVVLDIAGAVLAPGLPESLAVNAGGIGSIALAQSSPNVTRATLDLDGAGTYHIAPVESGCGILVSLMPPAAPASLDVAPASRGSSAEPPAPLGSYGLNQGGFGSGSPAGPSHATGVAAAPNGVGESADAAAPDAPAPVPAPAPDVAPDAPEPSAPPTVVAGGGDEPAPAPEGSRTVDPNAPANLQLAFTGTPLPVALSMLAYSHNRSVIVDDASVKDPATGEPRKVTMNVDGVDFEQAMNLLTMMSGLAWKKVGNAYVVASKERIQEVVPPSSRVVDRYTAQTLKPSELTKTLGWLHPAVFAEAYDDAGIVVLVGQADEVAAAIATLVRVDGGELEQPGAAQGAALPGTSPGMQVYALSSGDPQKMQEFLKTVVGEELKVTQQPGTGALVLQGTPSRVSRAMALLKELEAKTGERMTATYEPDRAEPAAVVEALKKAFPLVDATPVAQTRTLLLTGTSHDIDAAVSFARALDQGGRIAYESVGDYAATSVDAASLARLATASFPTCKFETDLATNRIVAMGSEADVSAAVDTLRKWDTPGTGEPLSYTYTPLNRTPDDMASLAEELIKGMGAEVTATPTDAVVVLHGPPARVAQVLTVLQEQDKPESQRPKSPDVIRVVQLDHVPTEYAYESIKNYFAAAKEGANVIGSNVGIRTAAPTSGIGQIMPVMPAAVGVPGYPTPVVGGAGGLAPATAEGAAGAAPGGTAAELAAGRQMVVVGDEETHRITLVGPKSLVERALSLIEELDVPQHQVTLHAMIVDLDRTATKDVGIDWDFGSVNFTERGSDDAAVPIGYNDGIGFSPLDRSIFDFQAVLNFIKTDQRSKLLARPNVKALDGQKARIQIGDELRFQVVQIVNGTAVTDIEKVDVGIILEFTPRIANDGSLTAELSAESSTVSGFTAGVPQIATRRATTKVRLENGQTMVIGGLIREEEIETIRKVPILSEIPFFGRLFKNRQVQRRPQELVMFLTPEIEYANGDRAPAQLATGF